MGLTGIVAEQATLSPEQIETFRDDGFLTFEGVFTPEEVEQLRAACESPCVTGDLRKRDQKTKTVHLLEITTKHPAFMELARSPKIVERIAPLIGPDIQLQHSKLATKPPTKGTGPFAWHQDFAFFPHTNTDLVAVMVALDDATPDNGCLRVVRGSHKLGLLDHAVDGLFTGACQQPEHWSNRSRVIELTLKAGGISLHHCMTLHGSEANRSGRPRRAVVFQYRADDAYQLADGIFADTGILIRGQRKERARCTAGTVRLPKSRRYEDNPFGSAYNQEGELARQREYF